MPIQFLRPEELIALISKLKDKTPDYPVDLMAARKAAFLSQASAIKIDVNNQGGKGGQGGASGGPSGIGFGGLSGIEGFLLQAVIGVWIIAAMLTAAYVFRDQIIDILQENDIFVVEDTRLSPDALDVSIPPEESLPSVVDMPATETPTTEIVPATENSEPGAQNNAEPFESIPDDSKDNPGLHLGQTPGPPEPPGKDKPEKPEKK